MAQIDAPQVISVKAELGRLDFFPATQNFRLIGGIEHLRFRLVTMVLGYGIDGGEVSITLLVNPPQHGVEVGGTEPYFTLSTLFSWSRTHLAHVLTQTFALCPNVDLLDIHHIDERLDPPDYFDRTE